MMNNLNKNDLYLIAVSGGPDSMALLDMSIKDGFNLVVAMVNYKTRDESDDEERLVRDYCRKNNIICEVAIFNNDFKGNFEDVARKFRYSFFSEIYKKYNCKGLFVAHQKDDVIETYLLKKKRNVINDSYLINEHTIINSMDVYRPLIFNYYKEDLLKYCNDNSIPYGIDKTNFMDIHTRNIIRKELVNKDKKAIYEQAIKEENKLIETRKSVKEFIKFYPIYLLSKLKDYDDYWLAIFLHEIIEKKYKKYANKSLVLTLRNFISSDKANIKVNLSDDYYIVKSYDRLSFEHINHKDFSYKLDHLEYIQTPYFKLSNEGLKMQGVFVSNEDFPIIIRNYQKDDVIKLKEGTKKVSRLFIDKKVASSKRDSVIVIENVNKEIIFVYGLYRKYGLKYVKNNLFIV